MSFNLEPILGGNYTVDKIYATHGVTKVPEPYVNYGSHVSSSRFFYVVKGIFHIKTSEVNLTLTAGDIIYLRGGITYTSWWEGVDSSKVIEYYSVNFILSVEGKRAELGELEKVHTDTNSKFLVMFKSYYKAWFEAKLGFKLLCISELARIFNEFLYTAYSPLDSSNGISFGVLYIENNYLDDTPISEIAKMCNVSEITFRRNFERIKKESPVKYRNIMKMKRAAELLESDEFSVSEIAEQLRFNDVYYFIRLFKEHYGVSPLKYKKEKLSKK